MTSVLASLRHAALATLVVVTAEARAARAALSGSAAWRRAYEDADGALFVRSNRELRVAGPAPAREPSAADWPSTPFSQSTASPILSAG